MSEPIQINFDPSVNDIAERMYQLCTAKSFYQYEADELDPADEDKRLMYNAIVENLEKEIAFNQKQLDQIWKDNKQND